MEINTNINFIPFNRIKIVIREEDLYPEIPTEPAFPPYKEDIVVIEDTPQVIQPQSINFL